MKARCLLGLLALAAAFQPAVGQDAAQPKSWRVAGKVVNSVTNEPVPRVRLSLRPMEPPGAPIFAISDEAGRFLFGAVPEGKFELAAERSGFPRQGFGWKILGGGFGSAGSAIITGPGLDMERLVFRLIPPSAISGRVLDDQGDPVQNAVVQLFRSSVEAGKRRVRLLTFTYTNDAGDYRLSGLGAGLYYVAAAGQPWYRAASAAQQFLRMVGAGADGQTTSALGRAAYLLTYYPDTSDPRTASAVSLKPGQEFTANIEVRTSSGVAVTATLGGTTKQTRMLLSTLSIDGNQAILQWSQGIGPRAVFSGVTPGRYRIVAAVEGQAAQSEMKEIDVGTSDLDVQIEPGGTPRISGKVELDGGDTDALRGGFVMLYDAGKNLGGHEPLSPDGSFSGTVPPGRYSVSIGGVKNLTLRSLSIDGAAAREAVVEIEAPVTREIMIQATLSSARVQGHVFRGDATACGAMVLLVPAAEAGNPFDYQAFQTEADGSFDFVSVRPGKYVLIPVEDGTELEYADPAVLAPLRAKGKSIELFPQETLHERLDLPEPPVVVKENAGSH
jgi:hypothetical protein